MTCVYKERGIKTKKVQEQWPQLKIKFSLSYKTWKLLFSGEDGEINLWWVGREDKNLMGGGSTGGIFPGGGNEQIFSWWEEPPPPSFPVGKPIYIYTLVPACVLITLANLNLAIFSVPRGTENLNKLP